MKENKQTKKDSTREAKVFTSLNNKKLEEIVGGPKTSRGTVTNIP